MKHIALMFTGSDKSSVQAFSDAISQLMEHNSSIRWNLVLGPVLMASVKQIPGVGYIALRDFVQSRYKYALNCTSVLNEVPISSRVDKAKEFLMGRLSLNKAVNIEILNKVISQSPKDERDIVFEGICDPCDGYGATTQNFLLELKKNYKVGFIPRHYGRSAHLIDDQVKPLVLPHGSPTPCKANIIYLAVYDGLLNNGNPGCRLEPGLNRSIKTKRVLMTMWEANEVPSQWPNRINKTFQQVIVPCEYCKEQLSPKLRIPIDVVPLGIDTNLYSLIDRTPPTDRPFRFLILFANHPLSDDRKNAIACIQAFNKVFANRNDVELIIKVSGDVSESVKVMLPSNCKIINNRTSPLDIRNIYHECDALLFPSRGEGYGMPPREAMSTGMPVIVTNFSATRDIAKEDISFPIEPSGLVTSSYAQWFYDQHNSGVPFLGKWANININDISDRMLEIFSNQEKAFSVGKNAALWIREHENIEQTSKLLADICLR